MSDGLRSPSLQSVDRFLSGSESDGDPLNKDSARPPSAVEDTGHSNISVHSESDVVNHPWFFFKDGSLMLIAEKTRYLVHGSLFRAHSAYWRNKTSDEPFGNLPEVLEDVSARELEALLSIIYPDSFDFKEGTWHLLSERDRNSDLVEKNWTAALRLSTLWSFNGIRALAVDRLAPIVSPVKKIKLSYTYDIPEWRTPASVVLCLRKKPLSKEESEGIPSEIVARIAAVRAAIQDRRIQKTDDIVTACMITGDIPEFLTVATATSDKAKTEPSVAPITDLLVQPAAPPASHGEQCSRDSFELCSDAVMDAHKDEVWNLAWSHNGQRLATSSRDKSAIVWRVGEGEDGRPRATCELVLDGHEYAVSCAAWSPEDKMLVTASEHYIRIWDADTGACIFSNSEVHTEVVSSIVWLPDASGFLTGSMDQRIIRWSPNGQTHEDWGSTPMRITDLALTADASRLVASGILAEPYNPEREFAIEIYDVATMVSKCMISLKFPVTSVTLSEGSKCVLLNRAPDSVILWDIDSKETVREFHGHQQPQHVVRSCFGGADEAYVMSGSEDGRVYVWHRECGQILDVLEGHGAGTVNAVRSSPVDGRLFASVGDDHTVRLWRAVRSEQ